MFTWQYQGVDRQYFSSLRRRHLHGPSVPQWEIQYTRKEKEEETGGLACLQDKSTLLGPLTIPVSRVRSRAAWLPPDLRLLACAADTTDTDAHARAPPTGCGAGAWSEE
eukprot:2724881-Rhodomonas_salina.2